MVYALAGSVCVCVCVWVGGCCGGAFLSNVEGELRWPRWIKCIVYRSWWRHQMETIFHVAGPIGEEFIGSPSQRPVTRIFLMLSLICAWTNGWVHIRDSDDLRRHRTHYDFTEMLSSDCGYILLNRPSHVYVKTMVISVMVRLLYLTCPAQYLLATSIPRRVARFLVQTLSPVSLIQKVTVALHSALQPQLYRIIFLTVCRLPRAVDSFKVFKIQLSPLRPIELTNCVRDESVKMVANLLNFSICCLVFFFYKGPNN